jgi:hypothetical protein
MTSNTLLSELTAMKNRLQIIADNSSDELEKQLSMQCLSHIMSITESVVSVIKQNENKP